MEPLNIGIAGLGTVGAATVMVLHEHADLLSSRCGRPIRVAAVSARNRDRDRGVKLSEIRWYDDPVDLARDPAVDVVVELIGGSDGPAREVVEAAISAGKHVVTANKAMMALHGSALARRADAAGVTLAYEAAVAGGIPAIKGIREGLAANVFSSVVGILNGTSNFILSEMRETGRDFGDVLAEAQQLGYAEADPTFDVEGIDAAHKLALLAAIAFNVDVDFDSLHIEGIRQVSALDIAYADELGFRIKLLAIARRGDGGLELRVAPCMVPQERPIAKVEGVFNAVQATGDHVGQVMMVGQGAGGGPTASAVVADIVDIARGLRVPAFGFPADALEPATVLPISARRGEYYVRLMVVDRPGVIADITAIMRDQSVSVESFLQRGRSPGDAVPLIIVTHDTTEAAMSRVLAAVGDLDHVVESPKMIRIERMVV
ncbi:homoserine dehydrogenase [Fodinicurvata sp. EGI_FJ10296]|uniref:homoserine dehydrogenase n=1 Tax=Fodinicurvata sp. EGI_FJ10296 TaxID=3231908 RepID=UPI00345365E7